MFYLILNIYLVKFSMVPTTVFTITYINVQSLICFVGNPASGEQPMEYNSALDHDYFCDPEPACLDVTVEKNMKLKEEMGTLRKEIQELKMQSAFGLQRFAGSDDDIQFYTG